MSRPIDHPRRCKGHSARTGRRCGKWAMVGQRVCRTHGGASPQAQRTARERMDDAVDELLPDAFGVLRKALRLRDMKTALRAVAMLFRSAGLHEPDREEWVPVSQVSEIVRTMIVGYGDTFLKANEVEDHDGRVVAWLNGVDRTVIPRLRRLLGPGAGEIEQPGPEPQLLQIVAPSTPPEQPEVLEL